MSNSVVSIVSHKADCYYFWLTDVFFSWPCSQDFAEYLQRETKPAGCSIANPAMYVGLDAEDVNGFGFFNCCKSASPKALTFKKNFKNIRRTGLFTNQVFRI